MSDPSRGSETTARKVLSALHELYPDADVELRRETPLELLVATILSVQSTDERVNRMTEDLFREYRTARDYAAVLGVQDGGALSAERGRSLRLTPPRAGRCGGRTSL